MGVGTNIAIGLFILIAITLIILIVIIRYREWRDPDDDVEVRNSMTQYSEGRSEGKLLDIYEANGKKLITMIPYYSEKEKKKLKLQVIEPVSFVVERNKAISLPRGTLDKAFNFLVCLPPSSKDFPEDIKDTLYGKALMNLTEEINAENFKDKVHDLKEKNMQKLTEGVAGLEIAREAMQLKDEAITDYRKNAQAPDRSKITHTPPPHTRRPTT